MKICFFGLSFLVLTAVCPIFSTQVHERGYWLGDNPEHFFDASLSEALARFFTKEKSKTIVDFGCGAGDYVKVLLKHEFDCKGFDGYPETVRLSNGVADVMDLSQPFNLKKRFDWVLSLEVGEHIPKEYEQIFIENLHRHNKKGIVLSWAIKGQGGLGHFNEQNNDYIKGIMKKLGYVNDVSAENELRSHSNLPWFKNTIMVFRKKEGIFSSYFQ